ncbi:MAG: Asp-tRNA(Asn)/Glu-tRNA(Gln) amidotransferase subunit GatC, partial [Candidatus Nezhaarchaeales archaeon]
GPLTERVKTSLNRFKAFSPAPSDIVKSQLTAIKVSTMGDSREAIITPETLEYLSELARLRLTESEKKIILRDLNRILEYFSIIDEVEVADVEPAFHVLNVSNVMREDEVGGDSLTQGETLANAGHKEEGYIKAPRMV